MLWVEDVQEGRHPLLPVYHVAGVGPLGGPPKSPRPAGPSPRVLCAATAGGCRWGTPAARCQSAPRHPPSSSASHAGNAAPERPPRAPCQPAGPVDRCGRLVRPADQPEAARLATYPLPHEALRPFWHAAPDPPLTINTGEINPRPFQFATLDLWLRCIPAQQTHLSARKPQTFTPGSDPAGSSGMKP